MGWFFVVLMLFSIALNIGTAGKTVGKAVEKAIYTCQEKTK